MLIACEQWTLIILFMISIISRSGKSQIPMPMPMPPMFMPPPMPMFMPPQAPMVVRIKVPPKPSTTTTTTTESSSKQDTGSDGGGGFAENGIAMPFPMPMPIQMGIPAMPPPMFCRGKGKHKVCPPCPPCVCAPGCTPSFFSYCSPCHKKCRCRTHEDAPAPNMGMLPPEPMPGPAYAVAFPPPADPVLIPLNKLYNKKRAYSKRESVYESEEDDSEEKEYSYRSKKHRSSPRHRRHHFYRKSNRMDVSDEFVRPEIAYIAKNGEVKLSRPLSNDEAANLLGEGTYMQSSNDTREFRSQSKKHKQSSRVQVIATNNPGHSQLLVMQDKGAGAGNIVTNKKRMLRSDMTPELLASGKKHLIFKPPPDKTISNISVSFIVT